MSEMLSTKANPEDNSWIKMYKILYGLDSLIWFTYFSFRNMTYLYIKRDMYLKIQSSVPYMQGTNEHYNEKRNFINDQKWAALLNEELDLFGFLDSTISIFRQLLTQFVTFHLRYTTNDRCRMEDDDPEFSRI